LAEHDIPIAPYAPQVLARPWGEEIFIAQTPRYLGKLLQMRAGTAGGLQYHVEKDETFYLLSGSALVDSVIGGTLVRQPMGAGQAFHIPPGAVHRVTAVTDCVFVETSTPHYDDRVRVEAAFGEPDTGGLPTTWPTTGAPSR
jgi:mannose-6-phosphate isomerase-like protein (cupin superfamily)